jgi:hypothetical protein
LSHIQFLCTRLEWIVQSVLSNARCTARLKNVQFVLDPSIKDVLKNGKPRNPHVQCVAELLSKGLKSNLTGKELDSSDAMELNSQD